jgi:GrpB-like predicted nucleotidyltransferase (UPF0157 family)
MQIEVVPYDATWPARFERIRADLAEALRGVPVRGIEHVGSTSVPGLAAKPVLDVDVIADREHLPAAIAALRAAGYLHRGELGIADRHALAAPDDGVDRNVYVVVAGSLALRNHLTLRAALRRSAALREEYGRLKGDLAARDGIDVGRYIAGKTELITRILAGAGFKEEELAAIADANAS